MGPEVTAPAPDAPTRRELRERSTAPTPTVDDDPLAILAEPVYVVADVPPTGFPALTWIDETGLSPSPARPPLETVAVPTDPGADLLATAPRRTIWRPGVLVPTGFLVFVVAAYAATTLLWPLHAVEPRIEAVAVQPLAVAAATPAWPAEGGAALSVMGTAGTLASNADPVSVASITKVVTALIVLDEMPLALGEQGPEYAFTAADRAQYRIDRANGESALDVPVGGTLTQYQMLEGLLVGSANNYADRLSRELFPSDAVFADAADAWLAAHGIPGVSIVDPSGILAGNAANPESLIPLAVKAMENPVIAEIVAKPEIDLPGAGRVGNTNALLADPGVVGLKTGTLDTYNLIAAKDLTVAGTTVRVYGSVLGQPDRATRDAAMRALFADVEEELQPLPSVPVDTLVGEVDTLWGEPVDVVTAGDATVVLWNGGAATAATEFALDAAVDDSAGIAAGATLGTLTVTGPFDSTSVDVRLVGEVEGPDAWWRLTHPLDLFGLNG